MSNVSNVSNVSELEGNTNTSSSFLSRKSINKTIDNCKRHWALTFQIVSESVLESKIFLESLLKKYCKKYTFELETAPTTGQLHFQIQLTMNNDRGVRFSQIKKLFPKFHIEPTICLTKSIEYCQKDNNEVVNVGYINNRSKKVDFLKLCKFYFNDFMSVYNEFFINCNEEIHDMEQYIDDLLYMKGFSGDREQAELNILILITEFYIEKYEICDDVYHKFLEEWFNIISLKND